MTRLAFTLDRRAKPELAPELGSRADVLDRFREGNLKSLLFSADVWTDGANKNHFRFPEAELGAFASSFKGQPFLMDHSHELAKRGGTILDSVLVERDGRKVIRQTIEAVKPWAIEGVLDGTIDRFSVGWDFGATLCTACSGSILSCGHLQNLGRKDAKTGIPVEVLWTGIAGNETSAVTHPAAEGTGQVMAQLSALAADLSIGVANASGSPEQKEEAGMKEKVLSLLNLPANTAEPEALSALEARLSQKPEVPKSVCAALGIPESSGEVEAMSRAVELSTRVPRDEHAKVLSELGKHRSDELVSAGLAAGKITPAMEEWARAEAASDPEKFKALLERMPKQIPVAAQKPVLEEKGKPGSLSPEDAMVAKRMGISPEDWVKGVEQVNARSAQNA